MNDQLKRIKSKDFSKIDEKIFEEQSKTDNICATLSHLSDFQKFLLEQIANMDKRQPSSNSSLIAKSIARNFDHLKESLVKCSRIEEKCEKVKVIALKEQLQSLREQLKKTKHTIKQQVSEAESKNKQLFQACVKQAYGKLETQKTKNEELYQKYKATLAENQKLKAQNQELKAAVKQQKQSIVPIQAKQSIVPIQAENYLPCKAYTQVNYRTPLKQTQVIRKINSNFAIKDEEWKITRNQITEGLHQDEKRNASLKRQTSNHQLSSKSHINCSKDKQNENIALRSKGVAVEQLKRGKSKQKIKLFSMI